MIHGVKRCAKIQKHQNSTIPSIYNNNKSFATWEGQFQWCVKTWNQTEIYQKMLFSFKNVESQLRTTFSKNLAKKGSFEIGL